MGYELHITRKDRWSATGGPEISLEDWGAYVRGDKSMQMDETSRGEGDEHASEAVWKSWPAAKDGREARLWHAGGNVNAANPDAAVRRKMFLIADALGAKLQGDHGEIYNSVGEREDARRAKLTESGRKKSWWRPW